MSLVFIALTTMSSRLAACRPAASSCAAGPAPRSGRRCTPGWAKTWCASAWGMYGFAIWDRRSRELGSRARDPFGIKPFFYALTPGGHRPRSGPQLRFASERKALADAGEVKLIDPDALRRYLSFQYVPAPATMVPPARRCRPARAIALAGGRVDVFRDWCPSSGPPGRPRRPRRARSWTRCAIRWPCTCAATSRWARSCPAA